MTILLYKDGRLVIPADGKPMCPGKLEGDLMMTIDITDPQEGDVLTYDGAKWVNAQPTTPETTEETEPSGGDE